MIMLDTLGISRDSLIAIIALVSIWAYPSIFVHLYAARKLDEAKRREAQGHRDIEEISR
ncbi:unnamed protein product [marine sediment metagenome]|uniref:Uncharacterized protein n=2 Tax=marine sediment metagenome TaxID=412755 RepID=X1RRL2_9ZZZZ